MFAELLAHPGVREVVSLRSSFGFMAFHGGSLEKGTDDIAIAAAEAAGASLYAVVQPPDLRWHIPSAEIDPAASPALAGFLDHVDEVVAVHGFGRPGLFTTILLGGGQPRPGRAPGRRLLRPALPDYTIVDDLDDDPARAARACTPTTPSTASAGAACSSSCRRGCGASGRSGTARDAPRRGERAPHTMALIDALAAGRASAPGGLG